MGALADIVTHHQDYTMKKGALRGKWKLAVRARREIWILLTQLLPVSGMMLRDVPKGQNEEID